MHKELDSLNISFNENWCIYKVPEFMLKGHKYFYQPLLMSIGPVFYKDPKLELMQKVKWIYLNSFLQHPENACQNLNPYIDYVRDKEEEIRKCYQQKFKLFNGEFVKMIVLDVAFLIYHFLSQILPSFDVPLVGNNLKAKMSGANHDLFQLENQIPYFVLKGIFDIAFGHIRRPITLIYATIALIGVTNVGIPGPKAIGWISESIIEGNKITDESNIEHLLDLRRMCCSLTLSTPLRNQLNRNPNPNPDSDSDIHCRFGCVKVSLICQNHLKTDDNGSRHLSFTAKQLEDAGVKFVAGETDNPLDVTFSSGKLKISKLIIQDSTETYLRNLVYFEQCHYYGNSYFIDYIIFLDQLIDTVEDVQVLVKNKIFRNLLGSDDDVVKLFNNIGKNVLVSYKVYSKVSNDLNCYASKHRHRWMAILRSKYFNHPWTILSVIAAIILFVLTLLQTIAAFIYK